MNTASIIKKCFLKAGMQVEKDDKAKYLFQLLTDNLNLSHNAKWKIIQEEFEEILGHIDIVSPNTGNVLNFDIDGYFKITDAYGKQLKRYSTFEKAIDYSLEND